MFSCLHWIVPVYQGPSNCGKISHRREKLWFHSHDVIDRTYVRTSTLPCMPVWPVSCYFAAYIFHIGHSCFDQLTPFKTRYNLITITRPYRGLKRKARRGHQCFLNWPLTRYLFFNWVTGQTLVNSPKHKRGFIFRALSVLDAATWPYYVTYSSLHSQRFWCSGGKWFGRSTMEFII